MGETAPQIPTNPLNQKGSGCDEEQRPQFVFTLPVKRIESQSDIHTFQRSRSYAELTKFLRSLSAAVEGQELSPRIEDDEADALGNGPPAVRTLCNILNEINLIADRCPPVQQPTRFGNRGFQTFYDMLRECSAELVKPLVAAKHEPAKEETADESRAEGKGKELPPEGAVVELKTYLAESFGNRTRIDYGTGHELNFAIFLLCLAKLGCFDQTRHSAASEDEKTAASANEAGSSKCSNAYALRCLVFVVFRKYLSLMRRLQRQYVMEPAGSRGVWGLDDFHFLPFYLGASQLLHQSEISPADACDRRVVTQQADRFMYLDAIREIFEVKKGVPLGECAPLLNDITAVPSWRKVSVGLLKMYEAEVLSRLPVAQHICFGSIFPYC